MSVPDPIRLPTQMEQECDQVLTAVVVTQEQVECLLRAVDIRKTTRLGNIRPQVLHHCSHEQARLLMAVLSTCVRENTWPAMWKRACVILVHRKKSKSNITKYKPISLLSVVGKIFKQTVVEAITRHLEEHSLLSNQQFGFESGCSMSDLFVLLSRDWQDSLDNSLVVALDTAGAFGRMWHAGLLEKLHAESIQGYLLMLMNNYL